MSDVLETVLLLALPASGKSEVRRYLASLAPEDCRKNLHLGPTVQLDDFPYVHAMRRIDDELAALGAPRVFFQAPDRTFRSAGDWGTLVHLLNEDHADLIARRVLTPSSAGELLLDRLDRAGARAGLGLRLEALDGHARAKVATALEREARELLEAKHAGYPDHLEGKTLVIEFARGGPEGRVPFQDGHGYQHSLSLLSAAILEKASILYIWVTPEESRRKNRERADPDDPGSILHHGVPLEVMLADYGSDDMDWLEAQAQRPGTVSVAAHGRTFHLPIARFDNRTDRTSFVREEPSRWAAANVSALREGLAGALGRLATARRA